MTTELQTSYFTFGQDHRHESWGRIFDKDVVIKIVAPDPREVMHALFDVKWSMEYSKPPNMEYFPRGIIDLNWFKCAICNRVLISEWTEVEAAKEYETNFKQPFPESGMAKACDDCYADFMTWYAEHHL